MPVICYCWALTYSFSRRRASLDHRSMTPHVFLIFTLFHFSSYLYTVNVFILVGLILNILFHNSVLFFIVMSKTINKLCWETLFDNRKSTWTAPWYFNGSQTGYRFICSWKYQIHPFFYFWWMQSQDVLHNLKTFAKIRILMRFFEWVTMLWLAFVFLSKYWQVWKCSL